MHIMITDLPDIVKGFLQDLPLVFILLLCGIQWVGEIF